eukprot:2723271-Pleurochrysis_carterae.AAC.3
MMLPRCSRRGISTAVPPTLKPTLTNLATSQSSIGLLMPVDSSTPTSPARSRVFGMDDTNTSLSLLMNTHDTRLRTPCAVKPRLPTKFANSSPPLPHS